MFYNDQWYRTGTTIAFIVLIALNLYIGRARLRKEYQQTRKDIRNRRYGVLALEAILYTVATFIAVAMLAVASVLWPASVPYMAWKAYQSRRKCTQKFVTAA